MTSFIREMLAMAALLAFFFASLIWAIRGEEADRIAERREAIAWYEAHPPSPEQAAANAHFRLCRQYRRDRDQDWARQHLAAEGCNPKDRDDPRYFEATFPWNEDAPRPWRNASRVAPRP